MNCSCFRSRESNCYYVFRASLKDENEFQTLYISGAVDIESRIDLIDALQLALASESSSLIINLSGVSSVSSSGVGAILNAMQEFEKKGKHLILAEPSPICKHVLELLRLEDLFIILKDQDSAVTWVKEHP